MVGPALLFALSITSVTPSSGPVSGGTTVAIHGTAIGANAQTVSFGRVGMQLVPATSFRVVDADTVEAVTPVYMPGATDVIVGATDGIVYLKNGFTYSGEISDAFERTLVPIFRFTKGAFGSEFVPFLALWTTDISGAYVPVFAFPEPPCAVSLCPPSLQQPSLFLLTRKSPPLIALVPDGDPGRILYVPKASVDTIAASLRVTDLSRSSQSLGTHIPIVRERDFRSDLICLLGVPVAPMYRSTLRIYSLDPQTSVHLRVVRFDGAIVYSDKDLDLHDPADMYHPGYAELSDFLARADRDVFIDVQAKDGKKIWAFVSITNNDTQQITIVAPH